MKDFFRFLAHPTQEKTASSRDVAFASLLYFILGPVIIVSGALIQWKVFNGEGPALGDRSAMTFGYLCFGVLVEELSFRVPLRNNLPARILASIGVGFVVSRIFLDHIFGCSRLVSLIAVVPLDCPSSAPPRGRRRSPGRVIPRRSGAWTRRHSLKRPRSSAS